MNVQAMAISVKMQTIAMNPPTVNVRNITVIGCCTIVGWLVGTILSDGRSVGCVEGFSEGDDVVGEVVGDDVVGEVVGDDVVGEVVGDDVVGEVVGDAVEGARE